MPEWRIESGSEGAPSSSTLLGPPEMTMPFGLWARIAFSDESQGRISLWTESSRMRLAMSCVYWEPQSRMMMFE